MMYFSKRQVEQLKTSVLEQSRQHDVVMLLDNNFCENAFGIRHLEFAAALGVKHELLVENNSFAALDEFVKTHAGEYVFARLGYDLKNELEKLHSLHADGIGFSACYAFVPQQLLVIDAEGKCIYGQQWAESLLANGHAAASVNTTVLNIKPKVSRDEYIDDVNRVRGHIIDGDVYELNYCTEFYAEHAVIDTEQVYSQLIRKSPVPFAAYVKHHNKYLLCASPERFITRKGHKVYSQPIKGTSARGRNEEEDQAFKDQLINSEKERAENLMIVDLVRNDLAKTAQTGTVTVEELFGIYAFPQVHQMISTVSAKPGEGSSNVEIIKQAFPMGSMTGAPKIMAMQLIEQYEQTKRGLYSGAVGYFAPGGNFDFNVVIRSIQYNKESRYLNFEVGSAITYDSIAEDEYNECLLKAKAMMEVLKGILG